MRRYIVVFFQLLLVALGVGLLVAMDMYKVPKESPWHYLGYHVGALFGSAGLVGLAFEWFNRTQFGRDWLDHLRMAFTEDPKLAEQMSDKVRQQRVKVTLQAQLDPETGSAIFDSIVLPYMEGKKRFRKVIRFDAHLTDIDSDVAIEHAGQTVSFPRNDFHRLKVEYRFTRKFEGRLDTVALILSDEYEELTRWFQLPNILYREVTSWTNISEFVDLVGKIQASNTNHRINNLSNSGVEKIATVSLRIDDFDIPLQNCELSSNKKTLIFSFKLPSIVSPRRLRWKHQQEVEYFLSVDILRAKTMCRLPLMFAEASLNPVTFFSYPESVKNVVPAPFFGGDAPYARVIHDKKDRHILVEMPRTGDREKWVFPPAGVIFTWDKP